VTPRLLRPPSHCIYYFFADCGDNKVVDKNADFSSEGGGKKTSEYLGVVCVLKMLIGLDELGNFICLVGQLYFK
jgi:hypothetical protein